MTEVFTNPLIPKNSEDAKQLHVLAVIQELRNSQQDIARLYTEGHCYEFAKFLQVLVGGEGELWYSWAEGHMYLMWKGAWWDINGRHEYIAEGSSKYEPEGDPAWRWKTRSTFRILKKDETHPLSGGVIGCITEE